MNQPKHTPGPWRWEVNPKSNDVNLCGGKPTFDLNVMGFKRWGMGGAQPEFLKETNGISLMVPAKDMLVPIEGREHHFHWLAGINHPDAALIASAPDLLEALKRLAYVWQKFGPQTATVSGKPTAIEQANAAISKALGGAK